MNKNMLRSMGAILAAFVTVFVLSLGTDFLLEAAGVFPGFKEQQAHGMHTWWMLLLATIYRSIYGVIGSYVSASLAPDRPMLHAMIPGIIGLVLITAGAIAMSDKGPVWYPVALFMLALPSAWLGGKLRTR